MKTPRLNKNFILGTILIGATLHLGCCGCKRKLNPSDDVQFEKYRARAERVATDLMDCISQFEEKGPNLTVIQWDLDALKKRGYRVSFQDGILTLRTFRKRWDVYFFSLGESFRPEMQGKTHQLLIKIKPFAPEADPTVIIDHGEYHLDIIEDHLYTWFFYLKPRLPPGYFPILAGWPTEYELREGTRRKMAEYRD